MQAPRTAPDADCLHTGLGGCASWHRKCGLRLPRHRDRYFRTAARERFSYGHVWPVPARSTVMTVASSGSRSGSGRALRLNRRPLLAAVIAAQLADLVTFIPAVGRTGIEAEQNPLARALFVMMGAAGPAMLKVVTVMTLVFLVQRVATRFPSSTGPAASLAVALGLLGAASNVFFGLLR
jgi:hypothetical protein